MGLHSWAETRREPSAEETAMYMELFTEESDQLQQTLSAQRERGDREGEASTLHRMAEVHLMVSDLPHALEYCLQEVAIRHETNRQDDEVGLLISIGTILCREHEYSAGLEYYQRAVSICHQMNDSRLEALIDKSIATVFYTQGDLNAALASLQNRLAICETMERDSDQAEANVDVAFICDELGKQEAAEEHFKKALMLCGGVPDEIDRSRRFNSPFHPNRYHAALGLGELYYRQGRLAEAVHLLRFAEANRFEGCFPNKSRSSASTVLLRQALAELKSRSG